MKQKLIISVFLLCALFLIVNNIYGHKGTKKDFPSKPITIIVHSKPGSGIDIMSRIIADIAQRKHKVTMVIENKPGTQGVVAMNHVLNQKRDGYTILGVTKSFLSSVLVNATTVKIEDFFYVAEVMQDAEVLIGNKNTQVNDFNSLVEDAKSKKGKQIWAGPGTGGRDQLMALKVWETLGISGTWVDYKSSPQTALALLRKEAPVSVGNPGDIEGKADLILLAVAHPERLKKFPEVPTFKELGYPLEEYMWRGYAVANGTPIKVTTFLENLFKEIVKDPQFTSYIEEQGAFSKFNGHNNFQKKINQELHETKLLLTKAGLLQSYINFNPIQTTMIGFAISSLLIISIISLALILKRKTSITIWFSAGMIWLSLMFLHQTFSFIIPPEANITSPALIPRIWSILLILLSTSLIATELLGSKKEPIKEDNVKTIQIIVLTLLYFLSVPFMGFYVATYIFLSISLFILQNKNIYTIFVTASTFTIVCYLIFQLALGISFPTGILG